MKDFCKPFFLFILIIAVFTTKISFAQSPKIDSLLTLIKTDKPDTNKVIHSYKLCWEYIQTGNYDTAMYYGNSALTLAQQLNFKKGIASSYTNIGNIYQYQSDYPQALGYYFKSLKIAEELRDKNELEINLGNIGFIYSNQSNYPKALDYDLKALKIAEEVGDKNAVGKNLGNIGNIYFYQSNYPKALDYDLKALKMAEEVGDKNAVGRNLNNIGSIYYFQNDYPKALYCFLKALKIAEEIGNKMAAGSNLGNIGYIYSKRSDYPQALDYFFKALKIAEELGDKTTIGINLCNIGLAYIKIGKFKEAEQYLKRAIAIDSNISALDNLKYAEEYLSQLYDTTGRYKEALVHYKKATDLKDSIFSQENKKQLVRKEMQYKFDGQEAATKTENDKQQLRKNIIIYSVAGGLLLVLVFSVFIFRSLNVARKQKTLIEQQKEAVEKQKEIVQEKNNEITASITYAKRIQTALLTSDAYIKEHLSPILSSGEGVEHFVLFKPKDIVSGDFYWALSIAPFPGWDMGTNKIKLPTDTKRKHTFYMMTADCTGHGVPGAFMSMLNISYLHENIVERGIRLPHDILNSQRKEIIQALNPVGSTEESKDGMDCILCVYDFDKMLLHFAAANNPLWLVREKSLELRVEGLKSTKNNSELSTLNYELTEYKGDKMPVGKYSEKTESFSLQTIALQKGDIIYTSTDGFADQFGGGRAGEGSGKKLMKKKFKEELLKICHLPMTEQKEYLNTFFEKWKGDNEQVDDVTVIGIRI